MAAKTIVATVGIAAGNITLTGPTASGDVIKRVKITAISGAGRVSFRTDGSTAVLDADETYHLPAVVGASVEIPVAAWPLVISAIASVSTTVHVGVTHPALIRITRN